MTISIIHRTCGIYLRNGFIKSAASTAYAAAASTCQSTCSSVRTSSTSSSSSSGEQATQENPNLTPDKSYNVLTRKKSEYALGKHRSNALELIQKQPVIEVDGNMAVCDGGGGALGHPLEYIKLGARADYGQDGNGNEEDGVACIYCGLRYRKRKGSSHDDHH